MHHHSSITTDRGPIFIRLPKSYLAGAFQRIIEWNMPDVIVRCAEVRRHVESTIGRVPAKIVDARGKANNYVRRTPVSKHFPNVRLWAIVAVLLAGNIPMQNIHNPLPIVCLLYTSPSPRDS